MLHQVGVSFDLQNKVLWGGVGRRSEARLPANLVAVISTNVPMAVNCSFLVLCNMLVRLFLLLHQPVFLFAPAFYWFLFKLNNCPTRCDCIQFIIFLQPALHVSGVDTHHQELGVLQLNN